MSLLFEGNKRRSRSKSKSRSRSPRADYSSGGDNCEGGLAIKSDPDLCEEELDHHSSSTEGPDSQTSAASSPTFQQVREYSNFQCQQQTFTLNPVLLLELPPQSNYEIKSAKERRLRQWFLPNHLYLLSTAYL